MTGGTPMRAAIFRNGEIVVDQHAGAEAGGRAGAGQDRWPAASAVPTCTRASTPTAWSSWRSIFPAASRWTFPATSCSATNSAARSLDYGPGTTRKLKPGTRVCSLPALLTAEGPQGIGYSNDNVGGYAERMLLSEALLLEVPNGLAAEHAALTEPLAVGVHAVAKANISGDEVPLVIGCGPVGLAVIAALKIKGLHPIVAADYSPARRALAEKLGADIVVDPARSQPYATWAEHAAMSPEEKAARPPLQALLPALKPALIFECVGIPGLIQQVFEGAPRDARIVVVGVCMETDRSEPMLGIMKELNVQYVLGYTPDEFAYSLAPDRGRAGRCGVAGDGKRRHRRRRAGVCGSGQSGTAYQNYRGAVAIISFVPAKAGTHTPWRKLLSEIVDAFFQQQMTGIMGPGLRRDDDYIKELENDHADRKGSPARRRRQRHAGGAGLEA